MPRNKRDLEKIEAIADRSVMMEAPLPPEAIEDIKRMIEDSWSKAKANPQPETRTYPQIVADIESDKSKSRTRKEFELMIAGIADRIKDHLDNETVPLLVRDYYNANQQPLQLVSETKKTDADPPLYEMIRDLRKRLN